MDLGMSPRIFSDSVPSSRPGAPAAQPPLLTVVVALVSLVSLSSVDRLLPRSFQSSRAPPAAAEQARAAATALGRAPLAMVVQGCDGGNCGSTS